MKIDKLEMKSFKGITSQSVMLDGKSTIFFGENGAGKSSILRAINLLYSNIINKIVSNRFRQGIFLEVEDIKIGSSKCSISMNVDIDDTKIKYSRFMTRSDKNRTHTEDSLVAISNIYKNKYLTDDSDMPIYVNYGVNRLVVDVPIRVKNKHNFDKLSAFEKAIENKIDFRTFFEWFRNQEDLENEVRLRGNLSYVDLQLECVRRAILQVLGDFSRIRVERSPLRMTVTKGKKNLRIEQLSDGEKCTLAMVGDLARRMALANPNSSDPLSGLGVVLIDEIELHMHPRWQRIIVNKLKDIFPNIQFIITTHSPQVLGEIGNDMNIFRMQIIDENLNLDQISSLDAWDSNYILEGFMNTNSLNERSKSKIEMMYDMIHKKDFNEAEKLMKELEKNTNNAHEDVVKARILISRGRKGL